MVTASFASALMLALAMPGRAGWWPLLFTALVPLLAFTTENSPGRSFAAGLLTGFLYHAALLYWIVIVLGRYGGLPFWLATLVMLLLSFYMALYPAFFAGVVSLATGREKERNPAAVMILAPFLWVGLDWLRGRLFSGFPWMDLGYGLYGNPLFIQPADLGGHHLVSFYIVLVNSLLLLLFYPRRISLGRKENHGRRSAVAACLFLAALAAYSIVRYQQLESVVQAGKSLSVSVVQGNIAQDEKWNPPAKEKTLGIYKALTDEGLKGENVALVVWPETALPFYPVNDPLFYSVTDFVRDRNINLLTGSPYFTVDVHPKDVRPSVQYFNSALLIGPDGQVKGRYNKQHLVPFGEYVPLSRFLPFLEPVVEHIGNFSPGRSNQPLEFDDIKAGVLICFESIFADLARRQVRSGANVLVNLTNDAWYGRSSAPYQSFAMSVLRSVETRRALIRAANTGISGFVDPLGRIEQASPLFQPYVLTRKVSPLEIKSVFTRFGFLFGPGCLILVPFLFFLLTGRRLRR